MSEAEPRVVHLDICPYGDMEIFLATSAIDVTYRVSSHQLCSSSTFFRAMLGPQSSFSEANGLRRHQSSSSTAPDSNANGSLFRITAEEEHDPTALATVLYVLHGRAQHIPESITFEKLLEIAIICDYYDCAAAMRPWDGIWMGPLKSLASSPGYESWLFISWVYGDQEVFGQMTKQFSRDGVMVDGEFGVMVGGKVERIYAEGNNLDAMADQRHKIGQEFVVACSDVLAKYDNDDTIKCTMSRRECDYIIYGGLRRGLKSNKLLSSDEGLHLDHIFQTVESMMGDVTRSIQSVGTLDNRNSYHYHRNFNRHHSCCNIIDEVLKILRAKLEGIKPLHLTSFSRESAASDSCTWDALLCPQRVSRNSSLRLVRLEICKFGDMEITLKTADIHATYLVSSHQLRTSSPVFRDLLSPDSEFGEHTRSHQGQTSSSGFSTDSGDRFQLEVQKDIDPTAFAVVLYILHAGGANLPGSIPFAGIVAVGVVCQYYECSASLGRWYGKWIDQWKNYTENNGYGD
ncbi:hypothetical protein K440DRAFT_680133 [Wilcoxina mikolae CBS 423.85]|nr:hypothetical protein K440DRAFT_680133 [Wilcoxina mikolae CBS 423.85]